MQPRWIALALAALSWAVVVVRTQAQDGIPLSHPAIAYERATNDPVAVMLRDPNVRARLESADRATLLKTLLEALSIREESQILIFFSSSLQGQQIRPGNPRALYG